MQVLGVITFIKLQNNTKQLNSEKRKMRWRDTPLTFCGVSYVQWLEECCNKAKQVAPPDYLQGGTVDTKTKNGHILPTTGR